MEGKALIIVRATVPETDRAAFDVWYRDEHLPDATTAFGATRSWRGWSRQDPAIHCAYYEFPSVEAAEAVKDKPAFAEMVAEFDRNWENRVTRVREVIAIVGSLEGSA